MLADLYTKSVEQLLDEGNIGIDPMHERKFLGDGKYEIKTKKWLAHPMGYYHIKGEGETIRDAIIDLYKNL